MSTSYLISQKMQTTISLTWLVTNMSASWSRITNLKRLFLPLLLNFNR